MAEAESLFHFMPFHSAGFADGGGEVAAHRGSFRFGGNANADPTVCLISWCNFISSSQAQDLREGAIDWKLYNAA